MPRYLAFAISAQSIMQSSNTVLGRGKHNTSTSTRYASSCPLTATPNRYFDRRLALPDGILLSLDLDVALH